MPRKSVEKPTPDRGYRVDTNTKEASMLSKAIRKPAAAMALALLLTACAQPWQNYQAGADSSAITAKLGPPREVYDLPDGGRRLMWPTNRWARRPRRRISMHRER